MNTDRQTHTHRSSALQGMRRGGVRSEIQQAHNEAYAQDKTTNALSSCTSQIKSNIVCYSIVEVLSSRNEHGNIRIFPTYKHFMGSQKCSIKPVLHLLQFLFFYDFVVNIRISENLVSLIFK